MSVRSVSTVGVLDMRIPQEQKKHAADTSVRSVPTVGNIEAWALEDQRKPAVDTSVRSVVPVGGALMKKYPEEAICSWIECATDQRSWAAGTED